MTLPFWITVFHGLFTLITVVLALVVANHLLLKKLDAGGISRVKRLAVLASIFAFAVLFTATYSYMVYRLPIPTSPRSVILKTKPWVHEVAFEIMEYGGLVGPILAVLITSLIFSFKEELDKSKSLRAGIADLILLGIFVTLLMSALGFLPTLIRLVT